MCVSQVTPAPTPGPGQIYSEIENWTLSMGCVTDTLTHSIRRLLTMELSESPSVTIVKCEDVSIGVGCNICSIARRTPLCHQQFCRVGLLVVASQFCKHCPKHTTLCSQIAFRNKLCSFFVFYYTALFFFNLHQPNHKTSNVNPLNASCVGLC